MSADIIRHVFALHQASQVFVLKVVQKFDGLWYGGLWVRRERQFDLVILRPLAIIRNDAKQFVAHLAVLGEGSHFGLREFRAGEDRGGDDSIAVLDQHGSGFLAADPGEFDFLHDRHVLDD